MEITWVLKGHIKNAQIAYLRVGKLLAEVRDRKLYAALGHADIAGYAEERLHLGLTSVYRYLQVYDWVRQFHKEWLEPKPKGFIPELSDAADLIWIEKELARKGLSPKRKAALEELQKKALDGRLRQGEVNALRRRGGGEEQGLKAFLSRARLLRRRGAQLARMPSEAIKHFDAAIEIIQNALALERAGIEQT